MSPIVAMIIQAIIELILWWIKNKVKKEHQPAALAEFELAYEAAKTQGSPQPLRDLWKRLRGA